MKIENDNFLSLQCSSDVVWVSETAVLGQDQSETKKSVLVLVLQAWFCVVKHGFVTLVVIMILKDAATF